MKAPKLVLTQKKYSGESAVVSLRIPKDMIKDIDKAASAAGRTRNELINTCLEFALNHLEIISGNNKDNQGGI